MAVITRQMLGPTLKIYSSRETFHNLAEFIKLINKWHTVFDELSLVPGDVIAVAANQTVEHFALFICAMERAVVYAAIPKASFLSQVTSEYDPHKLNIRLLFTDKRLPFSSNWKISKFEMTTIDCYSEKLNPQILATSESTAIATMSSGTTGIPKQFTHTHVGVATASLTATRLFYKSTDTILLYSSLNHVGVLTNQVIPGLFAGSSVYLNLAYDFVDMLDKIIELRPNKFIFFPIMVRKFSKDARWPTLDLSFIEEAITGGVKLDKDLLQLMFDKGVNSVLNVYGASEALPPMFVKRITPSNIETAFSNELTYKETALGTLVSDWQVKLVDSASNSLLYVKGVSVASGSDLSLSFDTDEYYNTNDQVVFRDGEYYMLGRADKMFRRDDVLINLTVLLRYLLTHPNITQATVIERDSKLIAGIYCNNNVVLTLDEVNAWIEIDMPYARVDVVVKCKTFYIDDQIKEVIRIIEDIDLN